MGEEILFSERQEFKQWWLWIILVAINGITILGVYKQLIAGQTFVDYPMSNIGLFIYGSSASYHYYIDFEYALRYPH